MIITFTPVRRDEQLVVSLVGEVLNVNGTVLDFSGLAEGAHLSGADLGCDWLASDAVRIDAEVHLTLILPHGPRAPCETLFPQPLHITRDGPVAVPPHSLTDPADFDPD